MATASRGRTRTTARAKDEDDAPRGRTRARSRDADEGGVSMGFSGNAGYEMARQAAAKQAAKREAGGNYGPNRWWIDDGDEEIEAIILDVKFSDVWFMNEHEIWAGREGRKYVTCTRDVKGAPPCAVCDAIDAGDADDDIKPPYTGMFITVLDTRAYTPKKGKSQGIKKKFSRRLMVVKPQSAQIFVNIMKIAEKQHGSVRGTVIRLSRSGDKSARHGMPVPDPETGNLIWEHLSEKVLKEEFKVKPVKDDKGKVLRGPYSEIEPFDWEKIFPVPKPEAVRAMLDLPEPEGTRKSYEKDWEEEDEDGGGRRGRGKVTRRGRAADEDEVEDDADEPEEDDEDDEAEEATPRRGRGKPAARRGRAVVDEDEEDEEDADADDDADEPEEEEPAPRRGRGKTAAKPAGRTRKRAEPEEDEDEEEAEDDEDAEEEEEPAPRGRNRKPRAVRSARKAADEDEDTGTRGRTRRRAAVEDDDIPF